MGFQWPLGYFFSSAQSFQTGTFSIAASGSIRRQIWPPIWAPGVGGRWMGAGGGGGGAGAPGGGASTGGHGAVLACGAPFWRVTYTMMGRALHKSRATLTPAVIPCGPAFTKPPASGTLGIVGMAINLRP